MAEINKETFKNKKGRNMAEINKDAFKNQIVINNVKFSQMLRKYGRVPALVYIYVLQNADKQNRQLICSAQKIAKDLGLSKSAVTKAVKKFNEYSELIAVGSNFGVTTFEIPKESGCYAK